MIYNRKQNILWFIIILLVAISIYYLNPVITPFWIACAAAYLLNPIVNWFYKINCPRGISSLLIVLLFYISLFVLCLIFIPKLGKELSSLINNLPFYLSKIQNIINNLINKYEYEWTIDISDKLNNFIKNDLSNIIKTDNQLMSNLLASSLALISIIVNVIMTPIITFYLLKDWPIIVNKVDHLIPRPHYNTIKQLMGQINQSIAGYVRGQTLVCLIAVCYYTISLLIIRLEYGLIIGLLTGIFTFVPYITISVACLISLIIGFLQFNNMMMLWAILAIFIIGQFIEGNIITPKLVGEKIGIHPVGIILSLLIGAYLFGFIGMLISLPVTSIITVLLNYANEQYKTSKLYLG